MQGLNSCAMAYTFGTRNEKKLKKKLIKAFDDAANRQSRASDDEPISSANML